MPPKVLITPNSFARREEKPVELLEKKGYEIIWNDLRRPLREGEIIVRIRGVQAYIAGLDEITAKVIEDADELRVISRYGAGIDNVHLKAATKKGIVVTNAPGSSTDAVADLAFALILASARLIPQADRSTKKGEWKPLVGRAVNEKTLGIIKLGKIFCHLKFLGNAADRERMIQSGYYTLL